ncbi:hypothetical protein FRC11_001869 [Ceratobasidium sp. 423]|nr:hypothetical protein FRC11_001869 [Ceratobasidium sp. 423]
MVDRATHKIVQLLQMFEEQHGMVFFPRNMVNVIYECGIVLLKEAAIVPSAAMKKRATALEASHVCLGALRGVSRTWSWAKQLAGQLEGKLNEADANMPMQSYPSDWAASRGDGHQTGQAYYQLVHVWDYANAESSTGSDPANQFSGMQIDPSTAALGLEVPPPEHQSLGNPETRGNLEVTTGSANLDTESSIYDVMSFPGTPSSSAASYQLPGQAQQGSKERMWEPRSY